MEAILTGPGNFGIPPAVLVVSVRQRARFRNRERLAADRLGLGARQFSEILGGKARKNAFWPRKSSQRIPGPVNREVRTAA